VGAPPSAELVAARRQFADQVVQRLVGDLSYWSPSGRIAVVYDALGRSVPPPGLVRLGTVQTGLESIGSAGNDFTMTIRRGP
jgi:hypothetical protein